MLLSQEATENYHCNRFFKAEQNIIGNYLNSCTVLHYRKRSRQESLNPVISNPVSRMNGVKKNNTGKICLEIHSCNARGYCAGKIVLRV